MASMTETSLRGLRMRKWSNAPPECFMLQLLYSTENREETTGI